MKELAPHSLAWQKDTSRGKFVCLNERPSFEILELEQVHGTEVIDLRKSVPDFKPKADGFVCSYQSERIPVIKTADCLPLLLLGRDAYALLHAGWRGLANPILAAPVLQDLDIFEIHLGPCIREQGFVVTAEFKENFPGSPNFSQIEGKLHFNLAAEALLQAQQYFPQARFIDSNECTYAQKHLHSFRRTSGPTRNWNLFLSANLVKLS